MTKLNAGDSACREIEFAGRRYRQDRRGQFDVPPGAVKALIEGGECFLPQTAMNSRPGWVCDECGHLSVFKTRCGRCGSTRLTREGDRHERHQ